MHLNDIFGGLPMGTYVGVGKMQGNVVRKLLKIFNTCKIKQK